MSKNRKYGNEHRRHIHKRNIAKLLILAMLVFVAVAGYLLFNSYPDRPSLFLYILKLRLPTLMCMIIASIAIGAATRFFNLL